MVAETGFPVNMALDAENPVSSGEIGGQFRGEWGPLCGAGGQQELTAAQGVGRSRCEFPLAPSWPRKWYPFIPRATKSRRISYRLGLTSTCG